MKALKIMMVFSALTLLSACGSEETAAAPTQEEARGVLTTTQQQALEAANSVEQTLLDAAKDTEDELNRRLQRN